MKQHECATTKICFSCKQILQIEAFQKGKGQCKSCLKEVLNAWRKANPEKRKAQRVAEYLKDGDRYREYSKSYREANPELTKLSQAKSRAKNIGSVRVKRRERYQLDIEFRNLIKTHNSLRHKRLRQSTPPWVTRSLLRPFFNLALQMSEETGEMYHVDHIIPLKGQNVSGLTVPANLRVIPASENAKKSNKLVEDIVWA